MVVSEVKVVFRSVCDVVVEDRHAALVVERLGVCAVAVWVVFSSADDRKVLG